MKNVMFVTLVSIVEFIMTKKVARNSSIKIVMDTYIYIYIYMLFKIRLTFQKHKGLIWELRLHLILMSSFHLS
jgi:hypothetical protein